MPRHYTKPRTWQPMTDPEWDIIRPHILWLGAGRPLRDLRTRVDGMFWVAASGRRWADLPRHFGRADTISRHFRRMTQRHLWQKLLHLLADNQAPAALKALEHWICRACQRAARVAGLTLITVARRLGFLSTLRGPPWFLPDPDLSETCLRVTDAFLNRLLAAGRSVPEGTFALCGRLLGIAGGRRRIPRCLVPA